MTVLPADLVREVNIDPHVDMLKVGQLVNCSTKGNPLPDLSWDPLPPRDSIVPTIGSQPWIAFTIPQAWEGMTKSFVCKASNAYGSRSEKAEETVSFKIHSKWLSEGTKMYHVYAMSLDISNNSAFVFLNNDEIMLK